MKTVILAGGVGTRLSEATGVMPKPMVPIGGLPLIWHIMRIYAHHGFNEFVVALGYRGDVIKEYFLSHRYHSSNLTISLGTGEVTIHNGERPDWIIHLIDTGPDTATGGRIKRLAHVLNNERFMLTYGDGVADVDVRKLVDHHIAQGKLGTVTAVRPPARFGSLELDGNLVRRFSEKPQIGEGWINGGFFVLEPGILDCIAGDHISWEHEPLERLAEDGELAAYRHPGFWQPMDTLREVKILESLWSSGKAPWRVW
ncbi:MAG TPA: glucose-1-phosphate cytidylyltransferase [Candidatus Dormibacteraeota bacterium]|nr:glucose-1-phosphate cytidylyltransferase [Candidatus Dormibacteraeota bacterium]